MFEINNLINDNSIIWARSQEKRSQISIQLNYLLLSEKRFEANSFQATAGWSRSKLATIALMSLLLWHSSFNFKMIKSTNNEEKSTNQ